MMRPLAIVGFALTFAAGCPAIAQQTYQEELDGAPPILRVPDLPKPQPAPPKKAASPATAKKTAAKSDPLKPDRDRLAQQSAEQQAQQARLDQQLNDLKAQQAKLDARAAQIAAEEKRLSQLRSDQQASQSTQAAQMAELAKQRDELARGQAALKDREQQVKDREQQAAVLASETQRAPRVEPEPKRAPATEQADDAPRQSAPDTPLARQLQRARFDLDTARRSCARAAADEAEARNYYAAQYVEAPRLYQGRSLELHGLMRLQDRRGYFLVDTVCQVDGAGEAQRFSFQH